MAVNGILVKEMRKPSPAWSSTAHISQQKRHLKFSWATDSSTVHDWTGILIFDNILIHNLSVDHFIDFATAC